MCCHTREEAQKFLPGLTKRLPVLQIAALVSHWASPAFPVRTPEVFLPVSTVGPRDRTQGSAFWKHPTPPAAGV